MEDVLRKLSDLFAPSSSSLQQPVDGNQQPLVPSQELYRRDADPDNGVISDAKQRVNDLSREIRQNEQKLATMNAQLQRLKEQCARQRKLANATAVAQLESQALGLIKTIKALEAKTARLRTRCANFSFGSENLRDLRDEEADERLLREMNMRMQMRLEQQDPVQRQQAVEQARFVNFQAGQIQATLNQSLQYGDGAMQDDQLLEEFRGFGLDQYEEETTAALYAEPAREEVIMPPHVAVVKQRRTATLDSQY